MSAPSTIDAFPTRVAAGLLAMLLLLSLGYSVVVMQSLFAWVVAWATVAAVGLSLFVVYLLYRFVVAVETIANRV